MTVYTMAARETRYRGVRFRSRLEARWAAFFDLAGWAWDYEPFDLEGWVPDFVLFGEQHSPLVEVKPFAFTDDAGRDDDGAWFAFNHALTELFTSKGKSCDEGLLCLGLGPFALAGGDSRGGIGRWAASWHQPFDAAVLCTDEFGKRYDLAAENGSYTGQLFGAHETCWRLKDALPLARSWWNEAGNVTRWRRAA